MEAGYRSIAAITDKSKIGSGGTRMEFKKIMEDDFDVEAELQKPALAKQGFYPGYTGGMTGRV